MVLHLLVNIKMVYLELTLLKVDLRMRSKEHNPHTNYLDKCQFIQNTNNLSSVKEAV